MLAESPLLYLGEEWGMLNDYDFVEDPAKAMDTRWVHRPKMKWEFLDELESDDQSETSMRKTIFRSLQHMIRVRKSLPALSDQQMELIRVDNAHILSFLRVKDGHRLIVLGNFSEFEQEIDGDHLRRSGAGRFFEDALTEETFRTSDVITLAPYRILWLSRV